jgi:hypothetical protein
MYVSSLMHISLQADDRQRILEQLYSGETDNAVTIAKLKEKLSAFTLKFEAQVSFHS